MKTLTTIFTKINIGLVFLLVLFLPVQIYAQEQVTPEELAKMSLKELMNINVITASLNPQISFDAPATIYVITEEQIKVRGYSSLEEVLKDIPEIEIQKMTNATTYNFISLRGIGGNEKFIVLMDGIQINSTAGEPHYVGYNYSVENAKLIEIILGPVSALYGVNAYSGVINIITNSRYEITKNKIHASYGSFNTTDNSIVVGVGNEDVSFSLTGKYYQSDEPYFPDLFKEKFLWYNNQYKNHGNVKTFSGDTLTLPNIEDYNTDMNAYFINARLILNNFEIGFNRNQTYYSTSTSQKPEYALRSDDAHNTFLIQSIYTSHNYYSNNEKLSLKTTISYQSYELCPKSAFHNIYTSYQPGYGYASDKTVKFEEQFKYKFNDNISVLTGISFENINALPKIADMSVKFDKDMAADNQNLYYIGSNITDSEGNDLTIYRDFYYLEYQNYGSFIQLQTNLRSNLKLTLGCRYDYNSRYGSTIDPRVAIVYSPFKKMNVKLLYGQASLSPSPFRAYQYFGSFYAVTDSLGEVTGLASGFLHLPNPDLKPEHLSTYEGSFSYFISDNFLISANAYYNEITDLIALGYTSNEEFKGINIATVERQINKGTASTYGGTARLDARFKISNSLSLNSYLSYSYTDGDIDGADIRFNTENVIKGGIDAVYNRFSLSPRFIYHSKTEYTEYIAGNSEKFTNDAFFLLNLYFRYTVFNANKFTSTVFLKANNLFNQKYYNVEKEGTFATFGRVPQNPIQVNIGIEVQF